MKQSLFFVAVAALFIISCQKEVTPSKQNANNAPCFRASIEQLTPDTKAYINDNNQLVWYDNGKTGDERVVDKIGIYFPNWTDNKYQSFTLSGGAGTTQGTFTIDTGWPYEPTDAKVAYFPWREGTNMSGDNLYFELPSEYWSYDNGDMVTPLVASISSSADISFKHAGAAVKLTINNLVSGSYKTKMTVYNKQIRGYYHINPTNAGTDAMVPNEAENTSWNNVTLNSWKSSGAFEWIFPVPELTTPKLKFEITDENGIPVWSKSLAAQANDLNRGDILVMPAISITPYQQFAATSDKWSVCGNPNNWGDTKMITDGKLCIAKSISFAANDQFKVRFEGAWAISYGFDQLNSSKSKNAVAGTENNNIKVTTAGTYDVIFNSSDSECNGYAAHEIRVVQSRFPYPIPAISASIDIDGTFSDWDGISGNDKRDEYGKNTSTMKAYSDGTHLFVYLKVVTDADGTHDAENSNSEVQLFFDKNNNSSDGSTDWYREGADDVGNKFRVKFASNGGLRDVLADGSYNAEVKVQDNASTKTTEMELKFDIAALNYNKTVDLAKQIKIFCLGYCTSEFVGECEVVIPD